MKRAFYILIALLFLISCETVQDFDFEESGPIDESELTTIGNALVKAFQLKKEQEFFKHFDKDLFKVKVAEHLSYGIETFEDNTDLNYFLNDVWKVLADAEASNRKFNLQRVFVEDNNGIIVISALTNNGIRFYEFILTNYNNSHRIYDIYYADLGFRLSDAMITQFPYDWSGISYMDESSIWEIDNNFDQGEYDDLSDDYVRLQQETRELPWVLGKYIAAMYQNGNYEGLERTIDRIGYNTDYLKVRLFRQIPLADSLSFYVNRLEERYGNSYVIDHHLNEVAYYKNEIEKAEKGLLTSLLVENDHSAPYVYLSYIAVESKKYRDAVKYLKILQYKFDRKPADLKDLFSDQDAFLSSQEYKSWVSENLIQEVTSDEGFSFELD